jgi:hypothetical protein
LVFLALMRWVEIFRAAEEAHLGRYFIRGIAQRGAWGKTCGPGACPCECWERMFYYAIDFSLSRCGVTLSGAGRDDSKPITSWALVGLLRAPSLRQESLDIFSDMRQGAADYSTSMQDQAGGMRRIVEAAQHLGRTEYWI